MKVFKLSILLLPLCLFAACDGSSNANSAGDNGRQYTKPTLSTADIGRINVQSLQQGESIKIVWAQVASAVDYVVRFEEQGSGNVEERVVSFSSIVLPIAVGQTFNVEVLARNGDGAIISKSLGVTLSNKEAVTNDAAQ
jgi:hypothetical protein